MSRFDIQSGFQVASEDGQARPSGRDDEEMVRRRLQALGYLE